MKTVSAIEAMASASDAFSETMDGYERIGDLAREHGVSLRTLRFYEDKGLLNPRREGTTRLYSRREKARLKLILLGRNVGFSLREVKQLLDLYEPSGGNVRQLRVALEKSEKQLTRLEKQRASIDEAIAQLKDAMGVVRQRLDERAAS
ncbi:MerR family DNA-binding transcriptional regulator [Nitratireductor mangrovi]|uniref:MerR family DNA-binding transcriptional regulator n=1 Tax=Nitratireductor mangrovi TaxID=2599600 RepID=A0A5B8L697_9HYPH|nr:MerR family DNA-binding transcriptional regulator [Nitratireductor mangrovi]QDZ03243.1 MerR family DNA-binding transcriptional regulator [Nitratireductor mangrovi]